MVTRNSKTDQVQKSKKTVQLEESLKLLRKKTSSKSIDRRLLRRTLHHDASKLKPHKRVSKRSSEDLKIYNEQLFQQVQTQLNLSYDVNEYCKNVIESSTQDLGVNTSTANKSVLVLTDSENKIKYSAEHGNQVRQLLDEVYEQCCNTTNIKTPKQSMYVYPSLVQYNKKREAWLQNNKENSKQDDISLEELYLQRQNSSVKTKDVRKYPIVTNCSEICCDDDCTKDDNDEDIEKCVDTYEKSKDDNGISVVEFDKEITLIGDGMQPYKSFNEDICNTIGDYFETNANVCGISSNDSLPDEVLCEIMERGLSQSLNVSQENAKEQEQKCTAKLSHLNEKLEETNTSTPVVEVDDVKILLPKNFDKDSENSSLFTQENSEPGAILGRRSSSHLRLKSKKSREAISETINRDSSIPDISDAKKEEGTSQNSDDELY